MAVGVEKSDIIKMEGKILVSLDFNLTVASPLTFLDQYYQLIEKDKKVY